MYRTILECVVGSTLHGTSVNDGLEDLDIMAVVVEDQKTYFGFDPAKSFTPDTSWVKRTKPEGVRSEAGDVDYVAHGLRKYLRLAIKGNPTVLLPLFAGEGSIRQITDAGLDLRALAPKIVSKNVRGPYLHYMREQHERLMGTRGQKNVTRPELVEAYGFDTKYAAHIVRLGMQGRELLLTGRVTLPMPPEEREVVLNVRTGRYDLEEVSVLIKGAELLLEQAFAESTLRDEPDLEAIEKWMLQTYLHYWQSDAA